MTQDEMIELADKAGFFVKDNEAYSPSTQEDHELTLCLDRFAKLVAEKERTWVGLTEVEIIGMTCDCEKITMDCMIDFANAIQDKLKELNNGK